MGIQAILDQFLNHRDQAVANNLAGLDLVDLCIGSVWTRCIYERGEGEGHTDFRSMSLIVAAMGGGWNCNESRVVEQGGLPVYKIRKPRYIHVPVN